MHNQATNNTKIATAVTEYSQNRYEYNHTTTSSFMYYDCATFSEIVPKHGQKINMRTFARMEPLLVPTFGRCEIHNKAFFVPYRTVWTAWTDFINGTQHTYSLTTHTVPNNPPTFSNYAAIGLFQQTAFSTIVSSSQPDLRIVKSDGTYELRNLTSLGRYALKQLTALGYKIVFSLQNPDFTHDALNLLCFAKVYCDWYFPSQYTQVQEYHDVSAVFDVDQQSISLDAGYLTKLFNLCYKMYYNDNFYTNVWDRPNAPNNGIGTTFQIIGIDNGSGANGQRQIVMDSATTPANNTYGTYNAPTLVGGTSLSSPSALESLSQQDLDNLKALSDYARRHQLVGTRALDRYAARWGIRLSPEILKRSVYLGGAKQDVRIGDIYSTADSGSATLGSYAGRGETDGNGFFVMDAQEEYGMVIVISTIVPTQSYYQGAHRSTMRLSKLDFYTPEFDNIGSQAVATMEVYCPLDTSKLYAPNATPSSLKFNEKVFGFVPRYSDYKQRQDMLSGDYVLNSRNTLEDGWTLFRNLDQVAASDGGAYGMVHNLNFISAADREQYHRIFQITDDTDKFRITHMFSVEEVAPWSPLYDNYEFKDEDKADKVQIDLGGVKAD